MADSNIGSLPQAANLDDDSLLVAEQQGQAVKVTGAQFKEFGRQAVIGQVQGYVDQAEEAASRAEDAVSSVTGMTVEADTLPSGQKATVTKSMKQGKVNLAFGLPRGEQGVPGPTGATGPRGPQGAPGTGLKILGYYGTLGELEAAVTSPELGDAYGVGTEAPYSIYIFDGVTGTWRDNGQLSGGGGGPLPENVVTAEGGATMTFPVDLGDGPHTITFTDEEEPPLTAEDIAYSDGQNVKQAIDGLKSSVSDGKALVASAITDKGVPTAQDASFQQMAEHIGQIATGSDTSDATATSFDILAPKTAYTAAGKVEGVIPTLLGQTIVPGTADKTIANGQYLGGTQVIKGDPNLTSGNIKSGVTLFGVEGALESSFKATLTVTADTGAVVTATHTDGTEVETLSTTGTVVLDLPLEGTWKVTAVRGVAQYNTVTIQVSSSYNAALTAEVHIEYYGAAPVWSSARAGAAAAFIGNHALFAGGYNNTIVDIVDAYDKNYTRSTLTPLSSKRSELSGVSAPRFALFCGGSYGSDVVDAYDNQLVLHTPTPLSAGRAVAASAAIGKYVLLCGGSGLNAVDAYDENLTRTNPEVLAINASALGGASNNSYAIFGGGYGNSQYLDIVTAYDASLTRTIPAKLSNARSSIQAENAGNYILLAGGQIGYKNMFSTVDSYDLFLTHTNAEELSRGRYDMASANVNGFALFAGGRTGLEVYYINNVDVYDPYLTHTKADYLRTPRSDIAATRVENSVLFGGGEKAVKDNNYHDVKGYSDVVEIYRYV